VGDEVLHCYRHPDRETRVSCSECGRGVCPDCMVFAPVGIRCLDHASQGKGAPRAGAERRVRAARSGFFSQEGVVTRILIGLNVAVFLVNLLQGASLSRNGGSLYENWVLIAQALNSNGQVIGVAEGEWWRMLTAAFLHGSLIHLGLNMLFLWFIGTPLEAAIGKWRFLAVYFVSALAGSAGALLFDPTVPTVGASGALYGILGTAVVLERQGFHVLGGSALGLVIINFVISLAVPGISLGGHLGGFIGGVLCGLVLTRFGRGHAAYGRLGVAGVAGLVAVGAASVIVAYFKVRGYT
jgi:membrane associated rhomboid family serine protease